MNDKATGSCGSEKQYVKAQQGRLSLAHQKAEVQRRGVMYQELQAEFQKALEHLVMLAKNDGSKHHAWHRAQELEKQEHGMYRGIKDALLERMKDDKA